MTFAEYNTDENFNKPSNAMELVRLGKAEGKTREDIVNSLSPLWKEDKKGNVKKALDYHFNTEVAPKEETKIVEPVTNNTTTVKNTNVDENFANRQNAISTNQEDYENERQTEKEKERWNATNERMQKLGESIRKVDDHSIENLPTFIWQRYKNGEFGDLTTPEGKKDAKVRLAYFMLNNLGTALKQASNAANNAAGRAPLFTDVSSDYEKYQQTNFANALENRWNKYKADTQSAIDLAVKEGADEQDLQKTIATISANNRLQSAFNQMNEREKVYALRVLSEVGGTIGNMNDRDFVNTLIGYAASGETLGWQEAAGMLAARFGKDGIKDFFEKVGGNSKDGGEESAGLGGGGKTSVTLSDGTKINPGTTMDDKEYNEIVAAADKLSQRYYDGEITEEEFLSDYNKLEAVMKAHPIKGLTSNIKPAKDIIRANNVERLNQLNDTFNELQTKAQNGDLSIDDYKDQYENLIANAKKWGADAKMLKGLEKNRLSDDKITGYMNKKNKKKK